MSKVVVNITTEDKQKSQRRKIEEKDRGQTRKKVSRQRKRQKENKVARYEQNMKCDKTRYDPHQDSKITVADWDSMGCVVIQACG